MSPQPGVWNSSPYCYMQTIGAVHVFTPCGTLPLRNYEVIHGTHVIQNFDAHCTLSFLMFAGATD